MEVCQSQFNRLEFFFSAKFHTNLIIDLYVHSVLSTVILNLHKMFCDLVQFYSLYSSCSYFTFAAINPDKTLVQNLKSDSSVSRSVHAVFLVIFLFSFSLCIFFSCSFFLSSFLPFLSFFFHLFHVTFPCTCTTWAEQSRAVNSWDILGGKNIVIFEVTSTLQRKM